MTLIQDFSRSPASHLGLAGGPPGTRADIEVEYRQRGEVIWTVKERDPVSGLYLPTYQRKNVFTDAGLTQLAARWGGAGASPLYLVIDNFSAKIQNAGGILVGVTSVSLDKRVDKPGDTQIVLGVGTVNQETVSFSSVTGAGPFVYTISATTKTHAQNVLVCRQVRQSDSISTLQSEVQYDAVAAPNQRMKSNGGFSPGTGQWTMQFFLTGSQALTNWVKLGLSDTVGVGTGTLHNHLVFGFDHQSGNDVELDITLTLSN